MGIQGLLPLLKPIHKPVNITEFTGQTVGVDVYCWLHKGAYGCAMDIVEGKETTVYLNYILRRVNMLLYNNVKPILVFDGSYLPSKADKEKERRKSRKDNKAKGLAFLRAGNRAQALECFQKCVDITPDMALNVIKACRQKGVDCVVAPYEADAQLAFLMKSKITQATISEDSDLLVYGCNKVVFKMDVYGNGTLVDLADLAKLKDLRMHEFTMEKFRHMCILSGCDYLPSIKGIGLIKANKLLRKSSNVYKLLHTLRLDEQMKVPKDYEKNFKQADETFLYQLAFDPVSQTLVPLNPIPDELESDNLDFAGPMMSQEKAVGIAIGNINPITGEVMAHFEPNIIKVISLDDEEHTCESGSPPACAFTFSTKEDQRRSLTPLLSSSWDKSAFQHHGSNRKCPVQKNLDGLIMTTQDSQPALPTMKRPHQDPDEEEEVLDDNAFLDMYTVVKSRGIAPIQKNRPKPHISSNVRKARPKNPFRRGSQSHDGDTKEGGHLSRYFNIGGIEESTEGDPYDDAIIRDDEMESDTTEMPMNSEETETGRPTHGLIDVSCVRPGALLRALADNPSQPSWGVHQSDASNSSTENKENDLSSCLLDTDISSSLREGRRALKCSEKSKNTSPCSSGRSSPARIREAKEYDMCRSNTSSQSDSLQSSVSEAKSSSSQSRHVLADINSGKTRQPSQCRETKKATNSLKRFLYQHRSQRTLNCCINENEIASNSKESSDAPALGPLDSKGSLAATDECKEDSLVIPSPVDVIEIDSGYLSDCEKSTDTDTPATPPLATGSQGSQGTMGWFLQSGSIAGLKTMKNQIQLNSRSGGGKVSGLGRCKSMGLSRRKSTLKKTEAKNDDTSGDSTILSYFGYNRNKRPRLESK